MRKQATLFLAALVLLAGFAFAQAVTRSTVAGKVMDASGAALNAVPVVLRSDVAPNFRGTATTNASGQFSFADVPEGKFTVSAVKANGVARASASGTVAGSQTVSVIVTIPAGQ